MKYDIFLSHANKDKLAFVDKLKKSFDKLGITIFYDKDSIEWGDKWKDRIKSGLSECRYGVIVISENFFGREWTEKELKTLLSRENKEGQKTILPILYNTTTAELYKRYTELSDIQFLDASKYDVKDITIQLARILLSEQKNRRSESDKNAIFKAFFEQMNTIEFFEWFDKLIQNHNQWTDDYDEDYTGWHLLKVDGKSVNLIQQKHKETASSSFYGYSYESEYVYRVNPIYYDDICKYFEKYIRPQM